MRLHKCSFLKPFLRLVLLMVAGFLAFLAVLSLVFPLHTDVPFAPIVTARDGTVLHAFLADDDKWRMKTELSEISPTLRSALLQKEDKWFYRVA